jgi:hypothetical protein
MILDMVYGDSELHHAAVVVIIFGHTIKELS